MPDTVNLALTGHRPKLLDGYDLSTPFYGKLQHELENIILDASEHYDVVRCHTGMALGADTVWGLAVLEMKEFLPSGRVELIAHIPYESQPDVWFKQSDKDLWMKLLKLADQAVIYGDLNEYRPEYRKSAASRILQVRNMGMIKACDALIAIWSGASGGTKNAVDYATETGKPIKIIDPITLKGEL